MAKLAVRIFAQDQHQGQLMSYRSIIIGFAWLQGTDEYRSTHGLGAALSDRGLASWMGLLVIGYGLGLPLGLQQNTLREGQSPTEC